MYVESNAHKFQLLDKKMSQKNVGRGQTFARNLQEARTRLGRGRDAPSSVMPPGPSVSQADATDPPTQS